MRFSTFHHAAESRDADDPVEGLKDRDGLKRNYWRITFGAIESAHRLKDKAVCGLCVLAYSSRLIMAAAARRMWSAAAKLHPLFASH